ncbi:hypothetical protein CPB86DRAFT_817415 [Serendipita vermifera]|nr:hypothetical protein CPB86DRAFT_817415 [Serendipita vermifera]
MTRILSITDGAVERNLRIVSLTDFSRRFATILNTYYQATISPEVRRGSFETGIYHDETKTTGSTIHSLSSPTYQRHWEWVILAHIDSLAMLGAAIIGIWLDKQVVTPDVYGYVSSMTRDNPYFPLPPNGCTLEGTQRAVLLRDVVVQFKDVAPSKKIRHLAFTMAGYKTSTEQSVYCRLPRARMYSGS